MALYISIYPPKAKAKRIKYTSHLVRLVRPCSLGPRSQAQGASDVTRSGNGVTTFEGVSLNIIDDATLAVFEVKNNKLGVDNYFETHI